MSIYSSRVDCIIWTHQTIHCFIAHNAIGAGVDGGQRFALAYFSLNLYVWHSTTSHIKVIMHWYTYNTAYSSDSEVDEGGYVVLQVVQCSVGNLK